jgi:hypothetical protein
MMTAVTVRPGLLSPLLYASAAAGATPRHPGRPKIIRDRSAKAKRTKLLEHENSGGEAQSLCFAQGSSDTFIDVLNTDIGTSSTVIG